MSFRLMIIALLTLAFWACSDQPLSDPLAPDDPAFHHGKGGHANTGGDGSDAEGNEEDSSEDSRVLWVFHETIADGTAARIRGDGRDASGEPIAAGVPAEFEGEVCAVHAKIFWNDPNYSQSGDAVLDPDGGHRRTRCGDARYLSFDLDGGTERDAPFMNALRVMQLDVGETRIQHFPISNTSVGGCDRLRFEEIRVTRTATEPGAWTVESIGSHEAACLVWERGRYQETATFELPFRASLTELPPGA